MKFTIQQLKGPFPVNTKFGPTQKYQIVSGGQTYDAWMKSPFTDSFQVGYSFEADLKGTPYKGIDTIAWPKQQTSNVGQSSAQLDRIEAKLDQLINVLIKPKYHVQGGTAIDPKYGEAVNAIPYADSPHPEEKDFPGF